jgi:hypothetical protein
MKTNIVQYLKEFWSPEKILLFFLGLLTFAIRELHPFYFILCRSGNRNPEFITCASSDFIENVLSPLAANSGELLIFFLSLLLLPLTLLRNWFKYIASWSIPAGLLIYWSGVPTSPGTGSMFAPAFNASAMMGTAVSFWLILLAGFVAFSIGKQIWNKLKSK